MKGQSSEITETAARRRIYFCYLQETRRRCSSTRKIIGMDCIYKFFWSGDSSGLGVGILLVVQWIDKALSVVRVNHRIMTLKLLAGNITLSIFGVYALQYGRAKYGRKRFLFGSA